MVNFSTKIASTVSVAALIATTLSTSVVSAASEFLAYAELLADNDVIGTQSTEAAYRLGDTVTRAELAKVAANLGGYTPTDCVGTYADVTSSLGDLCGYVEALEEAGVVASATNFRPTASVTRAEMVKMLLGVVGEEGSDVDAGYSDLTGLGDLAMYINRANEMGCAADSAYFRPNATASRGEAFKIAACVAGLEPATDGETPTTPTTPGTATGTTSTGTTVAGAVTVTLEGAAVAQYVPKNASSVKIGTIKIAAATSDVTLNSVTVTRSGLGPVTDIQSIQLAQSGSIMSDNRSLNSTTQSAIVRLSNAMTLKAGSSVTFDVLASMTSGAAVNSQHQFALTAVGAGSASVAGLPVTLGLINTTSYETSTVNVASITTAGSVTSGKTAQRIVNVKIDAGSNRDTTVNGFTLSKDTGEDYTKAFYNVAVYRNSVMVGTASMTSDKIYVTGLNTKLLAGETADYELRADTIYVGSSTPTTFKINESTDVSATETTTGYATAVGGAINATQTLTLNGVQVTWNKTSTGSKTVAPGASSVVLFDGKVTSDASFDVTNYTLTANTPVAFNQAAAVASFSRLVLNVDGIETDLLTTTTWPLTLSATSDKFRVEPGKTVNIKVTGTLKSNAVAASYKFTVNLVTAKNISNGNTVALGSSQAGDTVTVMNGKATFKSATVAAPSTKKLTANTSNSEIGRFSVLAEAEDITVRKLVFTNADDVTGSGILTGDDIADLREMVSGNAVKLWDIDTNTQIPATITVAAGTITADSMSFIVQKDVTKNIRVVVDTTALNALSGASKFTLRVAVPTAGDITRQSSGNADLAGSVLATGNLTGEFVAASSTYTAGKVVPTVTVAKASNDLDRFTVTITNLDPESAMNINALTIKATPGFLNGTTAVTWDGMMCVRNGATGNCGVPGVSTAAQNIATSAGAEFVLAGTIPNLNLVKNNGTVSFDVYANNLPFFSNGGLTFAVTNVKYDGSVVGEDFTGVSSAKVTATK